MEALNGVIDYVVFFNQENGYTVASFHLDTDNRLSHTRGKIISNTITVVGCFDRKPLEDEEYTLIGEFVKNERFGLQFKINNYERHSLKTKSGLIAYLSSEIFPGIGEKKAKLIVEGLGLNALNLIKKDPKVLDNVKLSEEDKKVIVSNLKQDEETEEAMVFLLKNGLTVEMANRINKAVISKNVIDVVKTNPYQLIDLVPRFGFKKADILAENVGISKTAPCRLRAMIFYVLRDFLYNSGNSYCFKNELYSAILKSLDAEIEYNLFESILYELFNEHKVYIDEEEKIFVYSMYYAEKSLAYEITEFVNNSRCEGGVEKYSLKKIDKYLEEITEESDMTFSDEQIEAIRYAYTEPVVIITGGPGTGKTTIVNAIIKMYLKLHNDNQTICEKIALLAPTGRAAKRLKETTSLNAMTIHKFLGYAGEDNFEYDKENRTDARLVIVDESSMMDLPLASQLICSMHPKARLIIVGDVDQLPSVGPGQVLKDLIDIDIIKTIRLTKIHRQASDSNIIKLAHDVNLGYLPENLMDKLNDRNFIATDSYRLPKLLVDLYKMALEKGKNIKDMEILIPMYKGVSGITEINNAIQEAINPKTDLGEYHSGLRTFRINDKVIQLVNRSEKNIMNGDIGYVTDYIIKNDKIVGLEVQFDTFTVSYEGDEMDDLSLAYAISIHKAQGSEFDLVIMPFSQSYFIMLKRKLIYTGITRAKKTLIMMGDPNALNSGISKVEEPRRTVLKEFIEEFMHTDAHSIRDALRKLEKENKELAKLSAIKIAEDKTDNPCAKKKDSIKEDFVKVKTDKKVSPKTTKKDITEINLDTSEVDLDFDIDFSFNKDDDK